MNKYLISETSSILDELKQIDSISKMGTRALFAINSDNIVVGSISDGDCHRGLSKGCQLSDSVSLIMKKDFTYIRKGEFDSDKIKFIREKGIKYVPELNEDGSLYAIRDFSEGRAYVPVDAVLMAG